MPKLWEHTIEAHRRSVSDAVLDAAGALAAEGGLRGVTMSAVAERTGIGRATLYRYFPDLDALLEAWHRRQVGQHLERLDALRAQPGDAAERLLRVLDGYARLARGAAGREGGAGPSALLHAGEHVRHAERHVRAILRDVLAEARAAGAIRGDIPADELATYCLHALAAAAAAPSQAAARRLVEATLDGLRFRR